ncbi:MAG: hypothetical protein F6K24_53410, partial [Okeania sp. SIO2D1]|nr:hypothetical protein [Okeania sp. SIO2D1]
YLPSSFNRKPEVTKESVIAKLSQIAPQQSLETTPAEKESVQTQAEVPSLDSLQKMYSTPLGKTLVEKQLAEHPEWDYAIVDDKIVKDTSKA